jgi:hypothetical protein
MVAVPLGLKAYSRDGAFEPQVELINLFVEDDESDAAVDDTRQLRLQRPGTTLYATTAGPTRAMYQCDGVQGSAVYVAAGGSLQTVSSTAVTTVGAIANDGKSASFAASFDKLAVASGGLLYFLNAGVLTPVAIPDADTTPAIRAAIDVTAIDNYIIVACPDGRWFYCPPGVYDFTSGTNALNFYTAESSADGLVACHTLMDELYLFGTSSVEVWTATGDGDSPFQREPGRNFARGCMSAQSVKIVDNTLFWVGDNAVVYRAAAVPTRISTFTIEEHIAKRSGDVSAFVYTLDAHEFYVLKIPGRGSFQYDCATKGWSRLKSYGQTEFTPAYSVQTNSGWLLGDTVSSSVLKMDRTVATDVGQPIERIVTGTVALPSRRATRNDSVAVYVGSSAPCSYRLRWHDGQNDFPSTYRALPARAGSDVLTAYRLGAGRESYRTFEISIVDPVIVRISAMSANESFD